MRDTSKDLDPIGPIGAEHTEADGDVGVFRGDNGSVVFAPLSYRRLRGDALVAVQHVQEAVAAIAEWQAGLEEAVADARQHGVSWDLLGWSVGTSGSAARQRWGVEK